MEAKDVSLVVAGGEQDGHRMVSINSKTTVDDILKAEDLDGYLLSLGPGESFLSGKDRVYDQVKPGGKIYATTPAKQG